jgi:hypothetical protein
MANRGPDITTFDVIDEIPRELALKDKFSKSESGRGFRSLWSGFQVTLVGVSGHSGRGFRSLWSGFQVTLEEASSFRATKQRIQFTTTSVSLLGM